MVSFMRSLWAGSDTYLDKRCSLLLVSLSALDEKDDKGKPSQD